MAVSTPVLPSYMGMMGDAARMQQHPASTTGLPSFPYASQQSLTNPQIQAAMSMGHPQLQAAMSSMPSMQFNNHPATFQPPPPHPTSMPQMPHMVPSYGSLEQIPRSAPNLPTMHAQPSSVYLPSGFGGNRAVQSATLPGMASFASFGMTPADAQNRFAASLAVVPGTMSDARLPVYSASAGQLDTKPAKQHKKDKKRGHRKADDRGRKHRSSRRDRRRRHRRRTRSSSSRSSSYSSYSDDSDRSSKGSDRKQTMSPRDNASRSTLPAMVSQMGPQIASLHAPTATAQVLPQGIGMFPGSTATLPPRIGYAPSAPVLPYGGNSLSMPVMPTVGSHPQLLPSYSMSQNVLPSMAMPHASSMTMPHAASMTMPHASSMTMPHAASMTMPHASSMTMPHASSMTMPHASSMTMPHAASMTTMPVAEQNYNIRLTSSPRDQITPRTDSSRPAAHRGVDADSVASGTENSVTNNSTSVSQPTRDTSKAKNRSKKDFKGKVTYTDYLPLADLGSTPLANYWMKTAGWKLYKPTRTNGSAQNSLKGRPAEAVGQLPSGMMPPMNMTAPANTPMMPTGFPAGAGGAPGSTGMFPPTPIMRGVGGVPTFSSQRLPAEGGSYPQLPAVNSVNNFSPVNVNSAVRGGLPSAVSNWVQPDVLNQPAGVRNRAASMDNHIHRKGGANSEVGSHAEITHNQDTLTAILHGNSAAPLHGKRKLHPALARWLNKYPKECPATTKIVVKQLRPENDAVPAFPNVARSVIDNSAHQVYGPNGERIPPHHGPHKAKARNASVSDDSLCEICGRSVNDGVHDGFHDAPRNPVKRNVCGCGAGGRSFTNIGENSAIPRGVSIAGSARSLSVAGLQRGLSQQTLQRMPSKQSLRVEYTRKGPWKEDFFYFGPPKSSATPGCV